MTDPAKRVRAGAIVVAKAFIVAGCFGDSAVGPCTLRIAAFEHGRRTERFLDPPYSVRLGPADDPLSSIP